MIALYQEELIESWIVFEKLNYCHWQEWDKTEQYAVLQFLDAFWWQLLQEKDEDYTWSFKEHFVSIAKVHPDINLMLAKWLKAYSRSTIWHFCEIIEDNLFELVKRNRIIDFEKEPQLSQAFIDWARKDMYPKLKSAESKSKYKDLNLKIKNTLEILENVY